MGNLKSYTLLQKKNSIGSLVAEDNERGQVQATFYFSRVLIDEECIYFPIEK
jgi:hypothetical protein